MKCCDVEPFLDQLSTSSIGEGLDDEIGKRLGDEIGKRLGDEIGKCLRDEAALREHLATCAACQQAVRSLARWDVQLNRAMNEIDVPEGLSQRLAISLSQSASVDPTLKPATADSIPRRVWPRTIAALTIACFLSAAIWGTWQIVRPPTLSTNDIATLLEQSTENPSENQQPIENSGLRPPQQWSSLKGKIVTKGWRQVELSNLRLTVASIPFDVRIKRGQPVTGSLFVIPKSRWTPTPTVPVGQAPIQYAPPHVWVVWTEKDCVYVLSLNGSVQLLEQLQRQLGGNQSVL